MPPAALAAVAVELAREQLAAGRLLRTTTAGQSMWPLLRAGAAVVVEPFGPDGPRVGDVALVVLAGRLALHRVIAVTAGGAITKGDAVAHPDPPSARDALLGRLARRPWDRWVARASAVGGAPLARVLAAARVRLARVSRVARRPAR